MKKINEDNLPRVHKHVKYNDSKDGLEDVLSTGKVLKKDPKRNSVLVYVLSGRSKGNRKWIPKEAIIEPEPTVNKEVEFVESFEMKEGFDTERWLVYLNFDDSREDKTSFESNSRKAAIEYAKKNGGPETTIVDSYKGIVYTLVDGKLVEYEGEDESKDKKLAINASTPVIQKLLRNAKIGPTWVELHKDKRGWEIFLFGSEWEFEAAKELFRKEGIEFEEVEKIEFEEERSYKESSNMSISSEGDITTSDYETFYQYGEVIIQPSAHDELEVLGYGAFFDKENWKRAVKYYMNREGFWPSVWYISDHGNPVLLDLEESKISTNLNKEVLMKDRVIRAIDSLIQEEVNKEVNPDVGSSVSSAGGLKVGDSVSWQDPQAKYERRIYGVVNMKDESKKELVVSSVADYADWGMGYLGQHYRIPYNEMNKFKVKKLSGVER